MAETYMGAIDKGLEGVIACTTSISYIINSNLTYRGYTIEDLTENSSFEEVVFLLWNGHLPSKDEFSQFQKSLWQNMALSQEQIQQLQAFPYENVHPMAWLRTATSMLALWDTKSQATDKREMSRIALQLTAKMGTLVALLERTRQGKEAISPNPEKSLAWNFLYMLTGEEPSTEIAKIFDTCLILHADHELNCSTFTARVTSSSLSDIYSAVVSAIGSLKGPLHGGANEQVMRNLKKVATVENANIWVKEALVNKEKIMGFGHRVYKNGDPRAKILKVLSERLSETSDEGQWYQISKVIDDTVQKEKGLLPNVDFYSATVYYSLGIPLDLYTPIFVVSRVSGWLAHIFEQYSQNRIYRPRGEWKGASDLRWKPLEER